MAAIESVYLRVPLRQDLRGGAKPDERKCMAYNRKISLDPKQLNLIEEALRAEVSRLAPSLLGSAKPAAVENKQAVEEINELLGHLHNQKFWHRPKQPVPMG